MGVKINEASPGAASLRSSRTNRAEGWTPATGFKQGELRGAFSVSKKL